MNQVTYQRWQFHNLYSLFNEIPLQTVISFFQIKLKNHATCVAFQSMDYFMQYKNIVRGAPIWHKATLVFHHNIRENSL